MTVIAKPLRGNMPAPDTAANRPQATLPSARKRATPRGAALFRFSEPIGLLSNLLGCVGGLFGTFLDSRTGSVSAFGNSCASSVSAFGNGCTSGVGTVNHGSTGVFGNRTGVGGSAFNGFASGVGGFLRAGGEGQGSGASGGDKSDLAHSFNSLL